MGIAQSSRSVTSQFSVRGGRRAPRPWKPGRRGAVVLAVVRTGVLEASHPAIASHGLESGVELRPENGMNLVGADCGGHEGFGELQKARTGFQTLSDAGDDRQSLPRASSQ